MEEWRPVVGYEGLYEVSNMGRVKSVERMKWNGKGYQKIPERILKTIENIWGYLLVNLYQDGKMKSCSVHRLVATAFLPNPYNLPVINHRDENKQNNIVSNLEWCTYSHNNTYNDRAKKIGEKQRNDPKRSKSVIGIDRITGLIVECPSTMEAERKLGIAHSHICACWKGKLKSAGNFYWYYADTTEE